VSFDLGVLDFDQVPSHEEVTARYAVLCEGTDDGMAPSARVDAFIAECLARWPGDTDADFESSPWASWPLETQRTAAGFVAFGPEPRSSRLPGQRWRNVMGSCCTTRRLTSSFCLIACDRVTALRYPRVSRGGAVATRTIVTVPLEPAIEDTGDRWSGRSYGAPRVSWRRCASIRKRH
jgi:hypothetical protein